MHVLTHSFLTRRSADRDAHVLFVPVLAERLTTQVLLHGDDRGIWDAVHARHEPDGPLREGQVLHVAGLRVRVLHTPGQTPGSVRSEEHTSELQSLMRN